MQLISVRLIVHTFDNNLFLRPKIFFLNYLSVRFLWTIFEINFKDHFRYFFSVFKNVDIPLYKKL